MDAVFSYSDYRTFLKDSYKHSVARNKGWSYGVWARKLGLQSPSTLVMIVKGQRNPGPNLVKNLVSYFKFDETEADYFVDLVRLEKAAKDPSMSVLLMERLSRHHKSGEFRMLRANAFQAISEWYYYAIRELVALSNFREEPTWIVQRLGKRVTAKQVRDAIQGLLELNLLMRDSKGNLKQCSGQVETESDVANEGIKRFHEQMLEEAKLAIRGVELDKREISGNTFCIREKDLALAKHEIMLFRRKFSQQFEACPGDDVYQLEVCFFPLTRRQKPSIHYGVPDHEKSIH